MELPIFFISSFPLASLPLGGDSSKISSIECSLRGSFTSTNSGGRGGASSGFLGMDGLVVLVSSSSLVDGNSGEQPLMSFEMYDWSAYSIASSSKSTPT